MAELLIIACLIVATIFEPQSSGLPNMFRYTSRSLQTALPMLSCLVLILGTICPPVQGAVVVGLLVRGVEYAFPPLLIHFIKLNDTKGSQIRPLLLPMIPMRPARVDLARTTTQAVEPVEQIWAIVPSPVSPSGQCSPSSFSSRCASTVLKDPRKRRTRD
jgi:hypothetical protein